MKIVNKEQFLKLPAGTLYSRYAPCIVEGLERKQETISTNDWFFDSFIGNIKCSSSDEFVKQCDIAATGIDVPLDYGTYGAERDGLYDEHELFAVYSSNDIYQLIEALKQCGGYDTLASPQPGNNAAESN